VVLKGKKNKSGKTPENRTPLKQLKHTSYIASSGKHPYSEKGFMHTIRCCPQEGWISVCVSVLSESGLAAFYKINVFKYI